MEFRSILALLFGILLFASVGCIGEKTFSSNKPETLLSGDTTDMDDDGRWDYGVYEFSGVTEDGSLKIKRRFSVSTVVVSEYTSFRENLTDIDLLTADDYLKDFTVEKDAAQEACEQNIGLISFSCADVATCARMCSAGSIKCKDIASEYEDFLGGSMVYFVHDNSRIDSGIREARNVVLGLRTASPEEKNDYLGKISGTISRVAAVNANPLVFHPVLDLCVHSTYGTDNLVLAAEEFGDYTTEVVGYNYVMTVEVESLGGTTDLGSGISGVVVEDRLPAFILTDPQGISSYQDIGVSTEGEDSVVRWTSSSSADKYVMYYKFASDRPPDEVATMLTTPLVSVKTIDLFFLEPLNFLYTAFLDFTGNHYIALGLATGVFFSIIIFIYTSLLLIINIIQTELGGRKFSMAVKKAFGKTQVNWKVDITVSIILLVAGLVVSTSVAPEPLTRMGLLSLGGYMLTEPVALIAAILVFLGILMGYLAVENFVKIIMLERIYGVTIREERGAYLAKISGLRDKLEKLGNLIEKARADEFDVSDEYDVLTSISKSKLADFEKKMTPRSKALVEEYLGRVESSIEKLQDKRKMADEHWSEWKEEITKLLSERNEVYASSLTSMPSSMRIWALNKYTKEVAEEGLVFERDVLKKKKVSALFALKEMTSAGLLRGGIVIKHNKITDAWLEKGKSPTVAMALVLKLRNYLNSLGRNMGMGDLLSFVSLGNDTVFVLMKNAGIEAALFVHKDKFKEAVEEWKKKAKMISE
jgi:hypothetical protein